MGDCAGTPTAASTPREDGHQGAAAEEPCTSAAQAAPAASPGSSALRASAKPFQPALSPVSIAPLFSPEQPSASAAAPAAAEPEAAHSPSSALAVPSAQPVAEQPPAAANSPLTVSQPAFPDLPQQLREATHLEAAVSARPWYSTSPAQEHTQAAEPASDELAGSETQPISTPEAAQPAGLAEPAEAAAELPGSQAEPSSTPEAAQLGSEGMQAGPSAVTQTPEQPGISSGPAAAETPLAGSSEVPLPAVQPSEAAEDASMEPEPSAVQDTQLSAVQETQPEPSPLSLDPQPMDLDAQPDPEAASAAAQAEPVGRAQTVQEQQGAGSTGQANGPAKKLTGKAGAKARAKAALDAL